MAWIGLSLKQMYIGLLWKVNMANPILRISDGTLFGTINLLNLNGWLLKEWKPSVPEPKGGGIFRNSPLVDGRKLAYKKMDNVFDTFNLIGSRNSQDDMITSIQELQRLLEKAASYWTTHWQNQPVWIEARAPNETYSRYATIVDYRLTGFGGPFQQPFFSASCESATEAILVIEHMFWQETIPGEDGNCLQISSQAFSPDYPNLLTDTFYPSASAHDATYNTAQPVVDLNENTIEVGYIQVNGKSTAGILFDNVTIPAGAKIEKAILTLNSGGIVVGTATLIIFGQDRRNGAVTPFDGTIEDFTERYPVLTGGFATDGTYAPGTPSQIISLADGTYPGPIDVTNIVQWIIGTDDGPPSTTCEGCTGWVSGDMLGLFIQLYSSTGGRLFDSFDSGVDFAELYVEYTVTGAYYGREATCSHEVYVANKQNKGIISHVFIYDADGAEIPGNWSTNLLLETLPYDILPDPVEVGDIIYFGSSDESTDGFGPFCSIVFDLSVIQEGVTGVWRYYDEVFGWTLFNFGSYVYLCGDQEIFKTLGVGSVVFEPMDGHAPDHTVNGVTGYWVKFEVTAVNTPTTPVQANRHIYTVTNPYVEIDELQVTGDIPALSRILIDIAACEQKAASNTLVVGLRSLSRGNDFAAYLNASNVQNPSGIVFNYTGGTSLDQNGDSITGYILNTFNYLPTLDTWNNMCSWHIPSELAKQYLGDYHVYVRGYFNVYMRDITKIRLRVVFGDGYNVSYSDISGVYCFTLTEDEVLDLGKLSIHPSSTIRPDDAIDMIEIYLDTYDTENNWGFGFIRDIILIPADEWIGSFSMPGAGTMYYGKGVDIDAITVPRQYRAVETSIFGNTYSSPDPTIGRSIAAEMTRISSSEPIIQANKNQRLWFTQFYAHDLGIYATHQHCGKVSMQHSARYLYARGNR